VSANEKAKPGGARCVLFSNFKLHWKFPRAQ
jgi:hypothetical protein